MADKLVHKVNDAADAIADAEAMIWAVFHITQGMQQDKLSDAIASCCNQAIFRLAAGGEILSAVADQERAKEGM